MKSQLKALISSNITQLEIDLKNAEMYVSHYYDLCDKNDDSNDSKYFYAALNDRKKCKRKIQSKLKRLRALQVEVKQLSSYTTSKTKWKYVNGKPQKVTTITMKEAV